MGTKYYYIKHLVQHRAPHQNKWHYHKYTVRDILERLNADRSGGWLDYVASDWRDGVAEWTNWQIITKLEYEYNTYEPTVG